MFQLQLVNQINNPVDVTAYMVSVTWSGDYEQAGRKLEFTLAYTTKDPVWVNVDVQLGDRIALLYVDDTTKAMYRLFEGRIFSRKRDSESYTMEFTAFDDLIYLAKSRITKKYTNVTVADAIRQTVNDFQVPLGTLPNLSVVCNYIADNISATESIQQALSYQTAVDNKGYHLYMRDGALQVVSMSDEVITDFTITDTVNLTGASVSESVEDMVSKVIVVDSTGQVKGTVEYTPDEEAYGIIQAICKSNPKQDDATQARSLLRTVAHDMSVRAIGHIQCITGMSVMVQEEQLKGQFFIKSDTHTINNHEHTMELQLVLHTLVEAEQRSLAGTMYNTNPSYIPSPLKARTNTRKTRR